MAARILDPSCGLVGPMGVEVERLNVRVKDSWKSGCLNVCGHNGATL